MRRTKQEITDPTIIQTVLQKSRICRLGMSLGDQAYVVPVSFGYADGKIFVHGAGAGRKVDTLRNNPKICFEMELEERSELLKKGEQPCQWGYQYLSIIGFGAARFMETIPEKRAGLDAIVAHYGGKAGAFPDESVQDLVVIEIQIESLTCKRNS
jgi:nitroimidazol reductase NimA-like FMN-containing flavoprotein (pyridoxamine 5'-phosphate oxidase superfamily)